MTPTRLLAIALLILGAFAAGAIAMLSLIDRLFGGTGLDIELDEFTMAEAV